ncbi:MAG: hypothetical protein KDK27_07165, partial [Leptospiraceae bacterium]|nr:hypothetical protein [Leptospiraceae bacterium]
QHTQIRKAMRFRRRKVDVTASFHLRSGTRAGFTLAEMAIVILLVGMLFTMMFAVLISLVDITSMAAPASKMKAKAFLALDNMRSSLNQTYYHSGLPNIWFVGRKNSGCSQRCDQLTFAAVHPYSADLAQPAVREVSFYLKQMDGQPDLYRLMRREDSGIDEEPGEGGLHYELTDNVVSLEFRYTLNGLDYYEEWDSTRRPRMPRIIQIRLVVKINERLYSFETLARPGLYLR